MSILIDDLKSQINNGPAIKEINEKWYIAKPYDFIYSQYNIINKIINIIANCKDAYKVLIGKSKAYHFKEDERNILK